MTISDEMTDAVGAGMPTTADEILANVEASATTLMEESVQSERVGRLTDTAVEALRGTGAMHMRVPNALRGPDLSMVEQMRVLARLAEHDSSSAWCSMVANNGIGAISIYLDDEGVAEVFDADRPPIGASVAMPGGDAHRVPGGYRVEGVWRFCSNVYAADWVRFLANVDGNSDDPIMIVVPQRDIRILKTWQVTGLCATGSSDFAVDDVFVPASRTAGMRERRQLRGRHDYTRDVAGAIAVYEHAAFAIGIARRSLRLLRILLSEQPARGRDREVVQAALSRLTLDVDAAEALAYDTFGRMGSSSVGLNEAIDVGSPGAVTTHVTELALRCALEASRRAGTHALFMPNRYDSTLRDMIAANAHVLVSDRNYAIHGSRLLDMAAATDDTERH